MKLQKHQDLDVHQTNVRQNVNKCKDFSTVGADISADTTPRGQQTMLKEFKKNRRKTYRNNVFRTGWSQCVHYNKTQNKNDIPQGFGENVLCTDG